MGLLANSNAIESGGYNIDRSLRFRSSASASLSKTFGVSPTSRTTMTYSAWVKRGALGSGKCLFGTANNYESAYFQSDDTLYVCGPYMSAQQGNLTTTQVFRDPSAWYHIVIVYDTTNATATDRIRLYVNGSRVTSFSSSTNSNQNNTTTEWLVSGTGSRLGVTATVNYFDGYFAELNVIDGQALTPSSFGETSTETGVWVPKKYTGTYGTNGFYLNFSDNTSATTLAYDKSGNGNNWTANNISTTAGATYDSMTDVPTLTSATAANYCTYNSAGSAPSVTLSAANLDASHGAFSSTCGAAGTFGVSSGKWYWEVTINAISSGAPYIGIVRSDQLYPFTTLFANNSQGYAYRATGQKRNNGVDASYGATYAAGDVIGVALDMDAGTLVFYKNNASQGTAYSSLSGVFMPIDANGTSGGTYTSTINFGQRPFAYTPPTGFVALNTYNLPTPTILAGNKYMDATLYTGNGSTLSVTNAGSFKPDLVWVKSRSATLNNNLFDINRGVYNRLASNTTSNEDNNTDSLTAFNTNGFSLGLNATVNTNSGSYVGWQWKGNGSTSSNTSGSITSTVSVSSASGFSVVTYTGNGVAGATIGHGLGVAPKMIVVKQIASSGTNWLVYHAGVNGGTIPQYYNMKLNLADAQEGLTAGWNDTSPTSSVFSVGTSTAVNANGGTYVAYCWTNIAGYSNFGYYTGNGDANGVFVYLGFRPKYIMFKRTDTGGFGWEILDTSRDPYNVSSNALYANLSDSEGSTSPYSLVDILSNGFKHRSDGYLNQGTGTYIYAAFAANPFKYANAR